MIKRMRVFFLILSFLTIAISHSQENLESNLIGEWEFQTRHKRCNQKLR